MAELSVVILATDNEQRAVLQVLVDGTSVARAGYASPTFPVVASDPVLRRIQSLSPDVILVDIPAGDPSPGLHAIELLHQEVPAAALFAIGPLSQPQLIVNAMRAGAREFVERPTTTTDLLEAFVRLTSAQRRSRRDGVRGKVFAVVNAKGGSGATTIAVNLAIALQGSLGGTALVDLAPLGHAALHLNLRSQFNVADAVRNLHRMDSSLMDSFMTRHESGLQLLAGAAVPAGPEPSTAEFARLFDMLVSHYPYVVVDLSTRLDATSRLVCNLSEYVLLIAQADVTSLWSAARVAQFLSDTGGRERVRLVLNRYRKVPGFQDTDAENAVGCKLIWKIPNHYFAVSASIDRGHPLMRQSHSEISRAFSALAGTLTEFDDNAKRSSRSMFRIV